MSDINNVKNESLPPIINEDEMLGVHNIESSLNNAICEIQE